MGTTMITAWQVVVGVVDVWILAAKHELLIRRSTHAARALLQQAIATNPDSRSLWLEVGACQVTTMN